MTPHNQEKASFLGGGGGGEKNNHSISNMMMGGASGHIHNESQYCVLLGKVDNVLDNCMNFLQSSTKQTNNSMKKLEKFIAHQKRMEKQKHVTVLTDDKWKKFNLARKTSRKLFEKAQRDKAFEKMRED